MNLGDCADMFGIPMVRDMPIVIAIRSRLVVMGRMSAVGFWFLVLSISGLWRLFLGCFMCELVFVVFGKSALYSDIRMMLLNCFDCVLLC